MEPVKFEERIKKQLQKREIKPAAGSWEKLEARLEQEEKPKRAQFWWIGVAAAIAVVFFFLGTLFNSPTEPAVVEQPSEEIKIQEPVVGEQKSNETLLVESTEKPEQEVLIASEEERTSAPEPLPEKEEIVERANTVAVQEKPVQKSIFESGEPEVVPGPHVENAVAEVSPLESTVTDSEVDALLNAAMAQLDQNQSGYAVQSVDAEDLLDEVEYELELNFRQKVFEVLKEGFSKARTAVANRNH